MANFDFDKVILNGTTYAIQTGGGGTVDEQLSPTSTNAVQNKAIYDETHLVEKFDVTHYGNLCESVQSFNDREFKISMDTQDIAGHQYLYYFLPVDGVNVQPVDENGQFIQVRVNTQDTTDVEWWDRTEDNFYAQNVVCTVSKENYYVTLHVVPTPISGHPNFLNGIFGFSFTSERYTEKNSKILMAYLYCHSIDIYKEKEQPSILSVRESVEKLKDKTIYVPTGGISTGDNFVSMSFYENNLYDGSFYAAHDISTLYFDKEYFGYNSSIGLVLKYHFFGDGQVTETLNDFESGTSLSEEYTVNTTGLKIYLKQKEIGSNCSIYLNADNDKNIRLMLYFYEDYTQLTLDNSYGNGTFKFDRSEDILTVHLLNCVMTGYENQTFENINVNYHDNFGVHVDKIEWYANCLVETIPEKINRLETDKQDKLVSGTNIKTINNESILGSGNITIQGGGSSYTAGEGIDITNNVISADTDEQNKVLASALVELHNDKADKQQLNNYQLKGNYVEQSAVDASIAAAVANYRTEAEAINVEKVDATALNDLDKRVSDLEQGGGGSGISGITMNGSPVTVASGVADLGTVITEHQSLANYYTKTEIDAMIGQINTLLAAI